MPANSTKPQNQPESQGVRRVTSMARWLARRRQTARKTPRLSVVMPVYNAESTLAECLTRLFQSTVEDFEVVLVDDGSTDNTRAIASSFPLRIVPTGGRVGPAAGRNLGAREAQGDVIFFIDSDVMVRPDTLSRLLGRFEEGDVDGLIGVQAADMRYRNLPSQYKNLWMRWTYLRKEGDVPLFYTTAAGIRRDVFLRVGGFDQGYGNPNVEDTAFGQKLARLGVRVRVQPELEVEHVKRYSLWGMLKVDFMRSVSMTRLKLRHRGDLAENNTSIPTSYMASVPLAGLGLAGLVVGALFGLPWVTVAGAGATLAAIGLNWEFLHTIRKSEGWARGFGAVPILWLELLVAGAGTAVGLATFPLGKTY